MKSLTVWVTLCGICLHWVLLRRILRDALSVMVSFIVKVNAQHACLVIRAKSALNVVRITRRRGNDGHTKEICFLWNFVGYYARKRGVDAASLYEQFLGVDPALMELIVNLSGNLKARIDYSETLEKKLNQQKEDTQ